MKKHVVLLFLLTLSIADAKPDKSPAPVKPKEKEVPQLNVGQTNYGLLVQAGRVVKLSGHPSWSADGEILPNGKVLVNWVCLSDGRLAHACYEIEDGNLRGFWGWAELVAIEEDGTLRGSVSSEFIYRVD